MLHRDFRDEDGPPLPAGQEDTGEIEILEVVGVDEDGAPIAASEVPSESEAALEPDAESATGIESETASEAGDGDGSDEIELIFETDETDEQQHSTRAPTPLRDQDDFLRERILRLKADFENFKSRIERERFEHLRYATSELVGRILPVLDNFDRAMAAARPGGTDDALLAGFALIQRQLLGELEAEGLRAMDSVGEAFDPTRHEAVATDSESPLPAHTVTHVFQRGYFLHDRVLRPALVRVSVNGSEGGTASDGRKES